jgi:photosystem II stability/assembly factor-like uncharacterized protein
MYHGRPHGVRGHGPADPEEVRLRRRNLAGPLLAVVAVAGPAVAQKGESPRAPLTKEEERARFHPPARGMDANQRLAGYEQRLRMEQASPLQALRFRSVGPEVQGGRIVDLESPRAHPDSLVVAFATGGLWRTDNRGGSWTSLFDGDSSITIGDFALADPEGQVIYLGTGESNSSRTSYAGTGVFKTTDAGRTWRNVGLTDSHHIGRVLVDARDPEVVFVAAVGHLYTDNDERGLYQSRDGGRSWTRVLAVDDRTGVIDLVQDPSRPDVLYAATWEKARAPWNFLESGPGSGAWKSTDGGETWTRLAGGFPTGSTVGRIGLALAPSRPDTLYAVVDNQARRPPAELTDEETPSGELTPRRLRGLDAAAFVRLDDGLVARFLKRYDYPKSLKAARLKRDVKAGRITVADLVAYLEDANRALFENDVVQAEVFRTDDGGATWRRTHEGRIDKVYYSFGYYFGRIAVDPLDAERVYFAGVPLLGSTDGGRTWTGLDQRGVHVDHHALFLDPRFPHRMVIGNDGGLNLSYDRGATWSKVNNLPVGQITTLALDNARPYNIVGGLQDNGVMRGPSTYKPGKSDPNAWRSIYGGDGSCIAIDPREPNTVYAASQFGNSVRLDLKSGERVKIRPRPELSAAKKEKPLRYNWITPFILSPHSRDVLYYGTNRLHRSLDRGATWTAISEDLTSNREQGDVPFGTLTSIAESPKRFGVVWAGTDEGKVWSTRDGGATWTDVSAGLASERWVTRVVASAFDEGTVYVSQNGYRNDEFTPYLWRSTDYGRTWQSLAAGLPAEPINTVREDPRAKHLLYVGTDLGVFVSIDRGATWTALTGGLPRVPVHDLLVHPREGDLVVATHGRSVFVAEAAPLRRLTTARMARPLIALPVKDAPGDPRRGYGEHPYITWARDEPLVRIAWWSSLPAGTALRMAIKDEHGSVWRELTATAVPGLNAIDYDLTADPARATAAEAVARTKGLEKQKQAKAGGAPARPAVAEEEEDEADEAVVEGEDEEDSEEASEPASGSGRPLLDADLQQLLADPLHASRQRYLPPGRYTIELSAAGQAARTTLRVKPPKTDQDDEE